MGEQSRGQTLYTQHLIYLTEINTYVFFGSKWFMEYSLNKL